MIGRRCCDIIQHSHIIYPQTESNSGANQETLLLPSMNQLIKVLLVRKKTKKKTNNTMIWIHQNDRHYSWRKR